jgi:uncharacterized membrane protein
MEKLLVVVFDNEKNAYEGARVLNQLDAEGSVTVYAASIISKNVDGTQIVKKAVGDYPIHTIEGTAIGSLIGLIGGPVGFGIGATTGAMMGLVNDVYETGVDVDFLTEVWEYLTPEKFALVADMSEEWVTPLDTRMEAIGGIVIRTPKETFDDARWARKYRVMQTEIRELKEEQEKVPAARKAKLQSKIDKLNAKMKNDREKTKQKLDQRIGEADTKTRSLEEKAKNAHGDVKSSLEARKAMVREEYHEAVNNLKELEADHLDKMAKKMENKAEKLRA